MLKIGNDDDDDDDGDFNDDDFDGDDDEYDVFSSSKRTLNRIGTTRGENKL